MSNAPINIQGLAPVLLVSVPQLEDPDFRQSVILLCEHDSSGAFGLVLNRPTETLASSVVRFRPPIQAVNGLELWIGGPVDPSRGWILLPYEPTDGESVCVGKGLFLSTSEDILRRLLEDPTEVEARLLTGHAGWDAGQLDAELAASAWLTVDADADFIFRTHPSDMWEETLRRIGVQPSLLQVGNGSVH